MTSKQFDPVNVWFGGMGMQAVGVCVGAAFCPLAGVPLVAAGVQTSWCAWKNRGGTVDAGKLGRDILMTGTQTALNMMIPAQSRLYTSINQMAGTLTQATVQIGRELLSGKKVDRQLAHAALREVVPPMAGMAAVQAMNGQLGQAAQVPEEILIRNAANGAVQNAGSQLTLNAIDKAAGEKKFLMQDVIPAAIAGGVYGLEVGAIDIAHLPEPGEADVQEDDQPLETKDPKANEPNEETPQSPRHQGEVIDKPGKGSRVNSRGLPPKGYHWEIDSEGQVKLRPNPPVEPQGKPVSWVLVDKGRLKVKALPRKGSYYYINSNGEIKEVNRVSVSAPLPQIPAPQAPQQAPEAPHVIDLPVLPQPYLLPLPLLLKPAELAKKQAPAVAVSPVASPVIHAAPAAVPQPVEQAVLDDDPLDLPPRQADPILDPDAVEEEEISNDEADSSDTSEESSVEEGSVDLSEEVEVPVVPRDEDLFRLPELPELPDVDDCVVQ